MKSESITSLTRKFIYERPSIRECLTRGVINYSALARRICDTYDIQKFDAVHAACKRVKHDSTKSFDTQAKKLIRNTELFIDNNVSLYLLKRPRILGKLYETQKEIRHKGGKFNVIDCVETIGVTISSKFDKSFELLMKSHIVEYHPRVSQLTIVFHRDIQKTAGIAGHLYSLIAYHGINIIWEFNCGTDNVIFIKREHLSAVIDILDM